MKKLTKLFIIIVVMIITVTPVYANGLGGNGSEGDGAIIDGGYTPEERAQYNGWVENRSGYRIYL